MKKTLLFLLGLGVISLSVHAEYRIYSTSEEFLEAKGGVCEMATDGCNTYEIVDGKIFSGTDMACENHTPEWNCTEYKSDIMTTRSMPMIMTTSMELEEPAICTMDYTPVCGMDNKTYSNRCGAENGAKVEVAYEGECSPDLSMNDISFYSSIKNSKLENKYQERVEKILKKYEVLISEKTSQQKKEIKNLFIKKIQKLNSEILMKYPQDVALSQSVNNAYLMMKLLEFELLIRY